ARVTRVDTEVQPVWASPGRIEIRIPGYRGNVALSKDLRRFDVVVEPQPGDTIVDTPIGRVTGRVTGSDLTLVVDFSRPGEDLPAVFYYSAGAIHRLRPAGN
ncbi:MAG TPA: hypothetical protein VFS23_02755, partial [Vicinamibacterales bacterium]|nr:hypothetical protein [Vicinamibacterales bacterium]